MSEYTVIMTETAETELRSILEFIIKDKSVTVAGSYLEKIYKGIDLIRQFPDSGMIPRQKVLKVKKFRFVIVESHLIFYKIYSADKKIIVTNILHSKQDYKSILM